MHTPDRWLFLAFCRGIKATRDHGYVVYSNVLWLADADGDFCVSPSAELWAKGFWDAWNSWDSVLPMWPNTTSVSALLISKSRTGRQKPQATSESRGLCTLKVAKTVVCTQKQAIAHQQEHNLCCSTSDIIIHLHNYEQFTSILKVTWCIQSFNHF